ncbi:EAL domain-containing response regulator [Aliikangiella sp. IMCC44359]|uniref:EAL domain-containing response regulator n=1 Tax=Aliikangiella sp. IMCC44359 TaxID=3459125 RepID=UPI00403ADBCD
MSQATNQFASLNILVVDDSLVQREHVINLCQSYGVTKITVAVNGKDAVEKLQLESFDLAFIDLEMPVMDGVSLIREIADKKLLKYIIVLSSKDPVLILSIGTMAESDGLCVIGTFKKPLQASYLSVSLNKLILDRKKQEKQIPSYDLTAQDLLKALDNDDIHIYFQPKLKAENLMLSGVEVLARWPHKQYGHIPPDKFISIAERFGVINQLTLVVIEKSFRQKQLWKDKGATFNMAVNLSPVSLNEKKLAKEILQLADIYKIVPEEITFEITENAIADQVSCAIEVLARLRLKGFQISIDDYGTGYASVQQLSRVPACELKIDKSMVTDIAISPQQQAILKNTLNMAADLNLKTVIEGVENRDDFNYLRQHSVDIMQGFLFAKPMDRDSFEVWWKKELSLLRKEYL